MSDEGLFGGNLGGGTTDTTVANGRFDMTRVVDLDGDPLTLAWAQPTGTLTSAGQPVAWSVPSPSEELPADPASLRFFPLLFSPPPTWR